MANRYWVGGTAAWDGTAGSKWALTSGGAGGQAVPTSADDVFFDASSGASTVTISTGNTGAKSITCTGFTGTLAGSTNINIAGSLTLVSAMGYTYTGIITFSGTGTLTTAGKTIGGSVLVSTAGITITLGDALTLSAGSNVSVTSGNFNTSNYNVTCNAFASTGTNARVLTLGSSTITVTTSASALNFLDPTNLTLNAGTSQINLSNSAAQFIGGSQTFYNVSFTDTTAGTRAITGANTFNNLSVTGPAAAGVVQVTFDSRQTINGALSTSGTAGNRRVWFRGVTYGLAQTLTINSAPSLTDADFRDIYVIGTAAPISGTRVGNLRGCSGITFDAAKTVYWNLAGAQNWSATGWATTSTGTPSTDNFPLAQDTATFTNAGSVTGTITMDAAIAYTGTVDMSGRTSAMTLAATAFTIYGDWKNGSGTTLSGTGALTYSGGRNTQTITSNGKSFTQALTVDSYGGTVQLADALNIGTTTVTVTNGTFDTKNYNVTAAGISSSNSNVRTITLGSSTLALSDGTSPVTLTTSTNLTFNAGTSQINCSGVNSSSNSIVNATNVTFYNVSSTSTSGSGGRFSGTGNTFNNITVSPGAASGYTPITFFGDNTITGTLTVAGGSVLRRIQLQSSVLGTARTLTVGTLSATDCDFRDITLAGAAAGSSPTRAGDCGGNTSITFSTKTVYWNLAGAQNWSATGWATSSGGTPALNNFPLAQDTAVFDNTGSVTGTITIDNTWNIGTFNASARTSAMTLGFNGQPPTIYGNWTNGSGMTAFGGSGAGITFSGRATQTITSLGLSFTGNITVDSSTGTVQLADAFTIGATRTLTLNSGTFDAVSYNVTTGVFTLTAGTLKMGSGTWTLSGTGSVWTYSSGSIFKGTANIVLSDTSTTARTFAGGSKSYNKLTIGGTTGISTTSITGNNQFTELASTKTVAHTIDLGATTPSYGAWTVTGTVGNVVTVSGTATITIAGARVSGVDYLAMGTTAISAASPGEFYAGANSTGTGTGVILTVAPAAVTRYWRGGAGSWTSTNTTNWATTSGGAGPASVPTSVDTVIFDTLSNATAYAVSITESVRCNVLTISGPATGNLTLSITPTASALIIHGNTTFAATGVVFSGTGGGIVLSGSTTGKTFTSNNVAQNAAADVIQVNGVGCEWTLGSNADFSANSGINLVNGSFSTANYAVATAYIKASGSNTTSLNLGSSVLTINGFSNAILFGTTSEQAASFTFTAGTSQLNILVTSATVQGNGKTFYNVSFTGTSNSSLSIVGTNTFNNLSVTGRTSAGVANFTISANQTINGTLTLSAGTDATMRTFVQSDTIGTTRTLTCAAFAGTDADFRDITIAGAAAPVSGTRLGDCKGNSGITFGAGVTRYWNLAAGGNWSATGWAASSGASPSVNNFPLAQDTALFEATGLTSGNTVTVNANYNIGTIDMSARTSNTMTLTCANSPTIYGNWINGTGTTLSGPGTFTFSGRGSQTITSASKTFTQLFTINTPGGSVALQDAFITNVASDSALTITAGTFNAVTYNVTLSGASGAVSASNSNTRTIGIGSGTWTLVGTWTATTSTNLTVTGTGTISLTNASAKTFAGGGISYSGITLDQGGAGALTISGNNTFKNITNSYSATAAATINLGTTTQKVTQFTGTGTVGKVLTIQGTSASSPGTLILSSGTVTASDYLAITGLRAYDLSSTWYAGANSTNNGSLGWLFSALIIFTVLIGPGITIGPGISFA